MSDNKTVARRWFFAARRGMLFQLSTGQRFLAARFSEYFATPGHGEIISRGKFVGTEARISSGPGTAMDRPLPVGSGARRNEKTGKLITHAGGKGEISCGKFHKMLDETSPVFRGYVDPAGSHGSFSVV